MFSKKWDRFFRPCRALTTFPLLCLYALAVGSCGDDGGGAGVGDANDKSRDVAAAADAARLDAAAVDATAGPTDGGATPKAAQPFSIVVLPDTQFYAEAYPAIFQEQANWIVAQKDARHIAFVVHEGDIVNFDVTEQWLVASKSLHTLDGKVPYVLSVGNHDLSYKGAAITRDATLLNKYFPAATLGAQPWPTGTFETDRMENHFQVLTANESKWVVISLEFAPRDAVVQWANAVLDRYKDLPAIVVTHAYLYTDSTRYSLLRNHAFHPCGYGLNDLGGCNDGDALWEKLISRHDNVVFVLSGHMTYPGVGRLTSTQASGRHTHQVLANYQTCGNLPCIDPGTKKANLGGDGFLRIITIDPATMTATTESFSPYLARTGMPATKDDDGHKFTLALDPWMFPAMALPRPLAAPKPTKSPLFADGQAMREGQAPVDPLAARKPQTFPARYVDGKTHGGCDGVHVVLSGLDATGGPQSVHSLAACLGTACEQFEIDNSTMVCTAANGKAARISCLNDEGMLRLFFFDGLSAKQAVHVVARDAQDQIIADLRDVVVADAVPSRNNPKRLCRTTVHNLGLKQR